MIVHGMKSRGAFRTALVFAAAVALVSCDNTFGIFASIQKEIKQTGTGVFLKTAVRGVADDGVRYYASMATLFSRRIDDAVGIDAWKPLAIAPGGTALADYVLTGMATGREGNPVTGTMTLYVAASDRVTGAHVGIFSTTDQGATWSEHPSAGLPPDSLVQSLFHTGGTLYVSTGRNEGGAYRYDLFHRTAGGFASAGAAVTGLPSPMIGGFHDGTTRWFVGPDRAYSGLPGAIAADGTAGTPTGISLTGIGGDETNGDLYVSTKDGRVYRREKSSGTWSSKTVLASTELGAIATIPASLVPGATGPRLAIAKKDTVFGYLEYDWNASTMVQGPSGILVPSESSYSTTAGGKPVVSFHLDRATGRIFLAAIASNLTGYGLYSNAWSAAPAPGAWGGWTAE